MTIKEFIQHPSTANIKLLAIGFIVGLFAQHSVDLKEQVTWLNNFLGSEEFKSGLVAVIGIVAALQQSLGQPTPQPLTALFTAPQANSEQQLGMAPQRPVLQTVPVAGNPNAVQDGVGSDYDELRTVLNLPTTATLQEVITLARAVLGNKTLAAPPQLQKQT